MDTPCIEWTNARTKDGYGVRKIQGKNTYVHRWIVEQVEGSLNKGEVVRHRCDNPPCFRYDHLLRGSSGQNNQDAYDRGRLISYQIAKTHCPAGHEYTEENTYNHKGHRGCKECRRQRVREWRQRNG